MTVSVTDAQTRLAELIATLKPGDVIVMTQNDLPVARLTAVVPVAVIPGVDPADVWEAAAQATAGNLLSHDEVFARLRART